ncbi:MAG: O-methyltransferase [Anaerolineae bacterium]|nr:O-methyltransferase [Anaerolineae bacterium]
MTQEHWTAIDDYLTATLVRHDAALEAALKASDAAGLPQINVAPNQGKFLMLTALSLRASRILEVGTLGGYSTIWLARGLAEGGRLLTLEVDPRHAEVARQNIAQAGVADKVEIRLGPALESLAQIAAQEPDPFDLIFIDADKENNTAYFEWALRLSRPGSLIIVDNVVRAGAVIDADSADSRVQGVRRFIERVAAEPRVVATAFQTVGSKGHDGLAVMLVTH